jgi:hypothetical protein
MAVDRADNVGDRERQQRDGQHQPFKVAEYHRAAVVRDFRSEAPMLLVVAEILGLRRGHAREGRTSHWNLSVAHHRFPDVAWAIAAAGVRRCVCRCSRGISHIGLLEFARRHRRVALV